MFYRFAGRQLGLSGNNGGAEATYAASVQNRSAARPDAAASTAGLFRDGTRTGMASYADFSQSYDAFTSGYQGSAGGVYSVQTGDSLQSIAQGLWGDASLWYKLAEANGLSGSATLIEGQVLVLPTGVSSARHNASTFTPYDAASAIGDLSPTTPKPPKAPKCGMMGQILLAAIAVAVTVLTKGAAAKFFGSKILGAMTAGAAGSIVSQGVGVATGIQDKFSFKGVAISALSAGVTAGLGDKFALFGKVAEGAGGGVTAIANAAARGALASAITQGVATATGLQSKFSWAGVAAAGVSAGVGQGLGHRFGLSDLETKAGRSAGNIAGHALVGTASTIASAATRSAITGTSFGDNVMAAIPDAIGQTIGRALGGAVRGDRLSYNMGALLGDDSVTGGASDIIPNGSGSEFIVNHAAIQRAVNGLMNRFAVPTINVSTEYLIDVAVMEGQITSQQGEQGKQIYHESIRQRAIAKYGKDAVDGGLKQPQSLGGPQYTDGYVRDTVNRVPIDLGTLNAARNAVISSYREGIDSKQQHEQLLKDWDAHEIVVRQWTAEANAEVDRFFGGFTLSGVVGAGSMMAGGAFLTYTGATGASSVVGNAAVGGFVNANSNAALSYGWTGKVDGMQYGTDFSLGAVLTPIGALVAKPFALGTGYAANVAPRGIAAESVPLVNMGKQGKHILGNNNFIPGRSVLTADAQVLAQRAGSGVPVNSVPRGQAGFKERVDFGEVIDDFVFKGKTTPTTNGIIHYDKNGTIHIVPSRPN